VYRERGPQRSCGQYVIASTCSMTVGAALTVTPRSIERARGDRPLPKRRRLVDRRGLSPEKLPFAGTLVACERFRRKTGF
jgi:hypothetical protein